MVRIDVVVVACVVNGCIDGYEGHMGWGKDMVKVSSSIFTPEGDVRGG